MKKTIVLLSAIALGLISCKKETVNSPTDAPKLLNPIANADWLLGEWGATFPDGSILTETWHKENDSTFSAKSYILIKTDTVFSEIVSLEQRSGKLTYVVTVPGQNNEKPVSFELTSSSPKQLTFENPQHDFPNKIVYNNFENDSLVAEISGIQNGKSKTESFPMRKLK